MRSAAIGAAVGGGLVLLALALTADRGQVFAQQAAPQLRGDDGLIAFSTSLGENVEQLTVIDPSLRTVGVYHVDGANGTIRSAAC
jgi:hypothetical protein